MRVVGCSFSPVKMNQGTIIAETKTFTVAIYFKNISSVLGNPIFIHTQPRQNTFEISVEYFFNATFILMYFNKCSISEMFFVVRALQGVFFLVRTEVGRENMESAVLLA